MCTGCDLGKRPQGGLSPSVSVNYLLAGGWYCQKDVHNAQVVTHLRVTCGNAPRGGFVQVHSHLPLARRKFYIFTRSKKNRRILNPKPISAATCQWPGESSKTFTLNSALISISMFKKGWGSWVRGLAKEVHHHFFFTQLLGANIFKSKRVRVFVTHFNANIGRMY